MSEGTIQTNNDLAGEQRIDLTETEQVALQNAASQAVRGGVWQPGNKSSNKPRELLNKSLKALSQLEREVYSLDSPEPSHDLEWLHDNLRLVRTDIQDLGDSTKALGKLPLSRSSTGETLPRCVVLANALLIATNYRLNEPIFTYFVKAVQQSEPLRLAELSGLLGALKLVLLGALNERGHLALQAFRVQSLQAPSFEIGRIITSLRFIGELDWKENLEQLSVIHHIFSLDPANVYPRMEFESRQQYRRAVAKIAAHSESGEVEIARRVLEMARGAKTNAFAPDAVRERARHVGYYLIDRAGSQFLLDAVSYRAPFSSRIQEFFRRNPDEVYIIGIEILTLITVVALIISLVQTHEAGGLILSALLLILPATQAAVELVNYLVTAVLSPRPLPKLDFSNAVDPDCATIVAVPTLLITEKQIRQLVDDVEVRYLVNRDPNIHYALLTDLPDSAEHADEIDPRVDLAIQLIEGLNQRYAHEGFGLFYLFHRHRVYNPHEGTWMGWERKRGKLLDLNKFLRGALDPFPVKAGDLARLPRIRYVLTLDSDTQLPRGSAQRMIGTMAHPLNRPVIDPERNVVTEGYGILQPRVGISVHSASRSRLANIYSGQTGFDIYSRAISDVYQDLYGEGIFTGKGIYDVDALRQVLENRFPRNALLSHDLIEGSYSRVGLASDIEVIDDYPSHYSAYNRRKHRWLRGDWQIVRWIFNRVPDESRRLVRNPISLVSRWKIFDNLRRSLVEPATFLLFLAGWFFLPGGPRFWTIVNLALLFLPIYFRLAFTFVRTTWENNWIGLRDAFTDFLTAHISILLNIAFVAHQALVSIDAIIRTIIRSTITHSRMLEWETATEAELGIRKRTPVDTYLDWMPLLGIILALCLWQRPEATPYALPFIIAWSCAQLLSRWLNRSPHTEEEELSPSDHRFLRELSLRTWRYFTEFSNANNHWLIPDFVQESPASVANKISPTNLGFLLNVRQAAHEFGYITLSEFVLLTERTLHSALQLPRRFGHWVNWYDNITLKPLEPQFVSTVDSGNLAAALWALKQGCLDLLDQPVIRQNALAGLLDHQSLANKKTSGKSFFQHRSRSRAMISPAIAKSKTPGDWLPKIVALAIDQTPAEGQPATADNSHWSAALVARVAALREETKNFMPWNLPEHEALRQRGKNQLELPAKPLTLRTAEAYFSELDRRLNEWSALALPADALASVSRLREQLPASLKSLIELTTRLRSIVTQADRLVREMDFAPLADKRRKLLSIGYDVSAGELAKSCYDLLASESRVATFVAVAKGEAPQENWFRLGRGHTICERQNTLISWTGTMFEYLMPVIWMRSHPQTLLDRATRSAVLAQEAYGTDRRVPWGISEAAFSQVDDSNNYQYQAFGVPGLALHVERTGFLVIAPYASCLALLVNTAAAIRNLRNMARKEWIGDFGFYESIDFSNFPSRWPFARKYKIVHEWMAHHQGMSLTAFCNVLHNDVFQRWFHAEPLVQASELILQERPLRIRPMVDNQPRRVLSFTKRKVKKPKAKGSSST